jgi:hypothetical protein
MSGAVRKLREEYVGRLATWRPPPPAGDTVTVDIIVMDADMPYGRTRFLVKPVAGFGEAWVGEATLTFGPSW